MLTRLIDDYDSDLGCASAASAGMIGGMRASLPPLQPRQQEWPAPTGEAHARDHSGFLGRDC